jgi:hypothetical protein
MQDGKGFSAALARISMRVAALAVLAAPAACSYSIHELYISSMDPQATYGKGRWVEAEASDFVVLYFEFGSDYVNHAYKELEAKCPGRIAQVTTEHLTAFKFLSYDQKVVLKGLCMS